MGARNTMHEGKGYRGQYVDDSEWLVYVGIVDTAGVDPLIVEAILGSLGAAAVQSFLSWANLPVGFDLNILRP